MAGEAPGPSAQRIHQQQPTLFMPYVNNNVSVRTGEEFSLEFLQDCVAARRVPAVANSDQKREKRAVFNYDQNGQLGYEDLTGILGLRRIDSESTSDMSMPEHASARTSFNAKEMENGAYVDKSSKYYKENGDSGHGSRKAFGELNFDWTGMGIPIRPPLHKSGSPHSNNYPGSGVSGGSQLGKMKFLCSFGGKILPRPSDGKLRYVGGDTHIISIQKRITREELMKKTLGICNQPHTIKYQLPNEDLDALISVSSDEDLQNMIEEYCGLERHGGSQRLRIFLIPLCESEILSSFDGNTIQQNNPDYQYVVAVNGILDHTPRKNTSGMSLASEAKKLGANLDCIPSFHRSSRTAPVLLELKGGFNALHPAQFFNQSQNMSRSPNHSPPHSPVPLQQEDSKSVHMQLHGDNSHKSSNESSSSSFTTQLPPEGSSTNTAGSKYLPQGEVTLMNHHHPNKQVDVSQPEHPHGEHIHNRNSRNETTSSVDRNDSDFDGFFYEKPKHKERTFHSEKPTSRPEDPLGLFSGSSDCIDSHRGMSHAFSDSKLNENGGSSAYCSQEGMSPLSPLNFSKAQPPLHLSASQEKPLQRNENMGLVYPQVQYMLVDVDPTGSQSRLDLLNSSSCSEIPSWNKPIYKVTGGVDDKYPTPGKDFSKSAFITLNHLEKNSSTLETMERLDEKYPFLYQGGKINEERSPATGLECKNILPNVKSNLTSSFGVDTSTQELQVSGNVLPASSAIYFKPFVDNIIDHPKNFQVEKTPPDLGMSQRTANNQDGDLTTRVIGEQEKYISGFGNSEVAGLCPSARQQSYDLSDLMAGSIYGLASHAPPLFQPVGSQKDMAVNEPKLMSSIDLYPSAVHDDSDLSSNLNENDHTLIGNPTEDALFMREFSLLDADFVSYPYQKVENLGYGGSVCEKSNVKNSTSENLNFPIKSHEKNQLESVIGEDVNGTIHSHVQSLSITVPYILDETSSYKIDFRSPAATEVEGSVIPEFESEDAKADDEDITYSISGAMIAEMEASIYGLQEKGTVTLEYKISNTGGDVCHGTLSGDVVSFIRYDTIEKAQMSQSLLQRLRTAEFVNPLMFISSKPNVWLVVLKIDSTLDQFKKKNTGIWSCDDLLDDKYKIIVRDIIAGVIQLVNQGYMGELKIQDIAIINGHAKLMRISNELAVSKLRDVIQLVNQGYMRELKIQDIAIINGCAKLMRISNELGVSKLRDQLQNLLEDLLGNDPNNKELIDFYSHLKSMQMCKLIHLRNHPILLTSQERLQIPVLLPLLLKYEKKSSNWKPKYDRQYRDEEVKKAKRLEKDQEYKVVYEYKSDQKREVNYIATKVEKDQDYKNVYKYRIYPNTASSQIDLSRNIIVHINDDGQRRTNEEVGKKLKYFFPDLWTRLFSLVISEGIDI